MFSANTSQVAASAANYIEDVFSTYLYTGNGATGQTITNGINLSANSGMVWTKARSAAGYSNEVTDTVRGGGNGLRTDNTAGQVGSDTTGFTSSGFTLGYNTANGNGTGTTYASWTFREQPKFFDVVTWTGSGANRTIAHNLGSVPGFIIVKRTDTTGDWQCYHRSLANTEYLVLNTTAAKATGATRWNSTTPTSTVFSLGTDATVNASGGTYVAYIFAHDAGGFGLTGTDNVISCGSFNANGSGDFSVNLGYEPQWLMIKRTNSSTNGDWYMTDIMRGLTADGSNELLYANLSNSALATSGSWQISSTGFSGLGVFSASASYIYIAIRRGPMKVPTDATTVFKPQSVTESTSGAFTNTMTSNFVVDMGLEKFRTGTSNWPMPTRLTGTYVFPNLTLANQTSGTSYSTQWSSNTQLTMDAPAGTTGTTIMYAFRRAPSFMDVVYYTGNGSLQNVTHNLTAVPELILIKGNTSTPFVVYSKTIGATGLLYLNTTGGDVTSNVYWNNTAPTSSVFTVGYSGYSNTDVNANAINYTAFLFATCAGVSKVGSYTGNGSSQTISCGFTGGARFVLIKRSNTTGSWYIWDTSRGMVSGTDPKLAMNSTAAETNADWVYTTTGGFQIVTSDTNVNANGSTYIFLAIA